MRFSEMFYASVTFPNKTNGKLILHDKLKNNSSKNRFIPYHFSIKKD